MFRASLTFNGRLRALKELNSPDWVGKGGGGGSFIWGNGTRHPPTHLPTQAPPHFGEFFIWNYVDPPFWG